MEFFHRSVSTRFGLAGELRGFVGVYGPWVKGDPDAELMLVIPGFLSEGDSDPEPWIRALTAAGWKGEVWVCAWSSGLPSVFMAELLAALLAPVGGRLLLAAHAAWSFAEAEALASATGTQLGDILAMDLRGRRVSLLGFSLGARVAAGALSGRISTVLLAGAAIRGDIAWRFEEALCGGAVGRVINLHSENDRVLSLLFPLTSFKGLRRVLEPDNPSVRCIGRDPVGRSTSAPGSWENLDVSGQIGKGPRNHWGYQKAIMSGALGFRLRPATSAGPCAWLSCRSVKTVRLSPELGRCQECGRDFRPTDYEPCPYLSCKSERTVALSAYRARCLDCRRQFVRTRPYLDG